MHHAPDTANTALLLIDVINDLQFDGGEKLLEHAIPMADSLTALKTRAKSHGIPIIYANDNFGRWRSNFPEQVERCLQPDVRGRPIVAQLQPEEDDYFVLKPKHSAFFGTNLEILLEYLGATQIILTGIACDICVLFSANDAFMRDFGIFVPPDCIASESRERNWQALMLMQRILKADITHSTDLKLDRIISSGRRRLHRSVAAERKKVVSKY